MSYSVLMILFFVKLVSSNSTDNEVQFNFSCYLNPNDIANAQSNGLISFTSNDTLRNKGQVYYNTPLRFKSSTNGTVHSFSTTFVFAMVPEGKIPRGHGLVFAITPSGVISKASTSTYFGLFNTTNMGLSSNHIVAVEFDTILTSDFEDINDNHVGVDINDLISLASTSAGFFSDSDGRFNELELLGGEPVQAWVEYDGSIKQLNITIHPINVPKPQSALISLTKDLAPYMLEHMYVGFSSSVQSSVKTFHYLFSWSFAMNGKAAEIDISRLPSYPGRDTMGRYERIQKMLTIVLSLTGVTLFLVMVFGILFLLKRRKLNDFVEEWEVLYGPHRFRYKDLYVATKGFKDKSLLGKGGFGMVYFGVLSSSNIQIAVKRLFSHNDDRGVKEFVAEIATIGRLRHPNLVRLLGYCRRKGEMFLVYDYMPNGSLDKFLYGELNCILNWTQRFKIIKNIASALFYLHQQWVQVIIHRDIKPANVLIDSDMNARLGDFGLAKICDNGCDLHTSHVAGTLGYMAPELVRSGKATMASDIYAFGVFMLEVACGRRPIRYRVSQQETFLVDWVMDCWEKGTILETIDSKLGDEYIELEVQIVLKLGMFCSHPVATVRPTMSSVMQILDGVARLPDNLSTIMKSGHLVGVRSNDQTSSSPDAFNEILSIPTISITESFARHGR